MMNFQKLSTPPQLHTEYLDQFSDKLNSMIGIAFCESGSGRTGMPGWGSGAWGYHGDDRHTFHAGGKGDSYGPTFGAGDVIGCGVDFGSGTAWFTKNGRMLGTSRSFEYPG